MSYLTETKLLRFIIPDRLRSGLIGGLLTVFFIGAFLRLYQLDRQILAGDEWHAIDVALHSNYLQIFSDYGSGGHSIPMALYDKLLMDTVGLSEPAVYAPFVIFGILMILILPLLTYKFIGGLNTGLFAALLSLSPLFIFYSRFARPYGLIALFGFLAIYFFYLWMTENHTRGPFILYVLFATLTVYLHVVAAPFVFGALVYYSIVKLYKGKDDILKTAGNLIKTFALALGPTIILTAWPLIDSLNAITDKANQTGIPLMTILQSFQILTGSRNYFFSLLSLGLLFIGIGWNLRRPDNRQFSLYLIFLSLIQVLFVIVSKPLAASGDHIFSRYIINVEPILLLFIATGVGWAVRKFKRAIPVAVVAVFCLYWYYCIPAQLFRYNNSTHIFWLAEMKFGIDFDKFLFQKIIKRPPAFYSTLNSYDDGTVSLVEVPYHPNGYYIYAYQLLHHQKVAMGFVNGLCTGNRWGEVPAATKNVALANFVSLANLNELSEKKVDFVVFHKNLQNEVSVAVEHQQLDLSKCVEQYQRWFGQPYYEDDIITVFSTGQGRQNEGRR